MASLEGSFIGPADLPIGQVVKVHPPDEKGDILVEIELQPAWMHPEITIEVAQGEELTLIAEHCYGLKRGPTETDERLRQACKDRFSLMNWHPTRPEKPKAPKYPNECPCGIAAVRCEYHRDL